MGKLHLIPFFRQHRWSTYLKKTNNVSLLHIKNVIFIKYKCITITLLYKYKKIEFYTKNQEHYPLESVYKSKCA